MQEGAHSLAEAARRIAVVRRAFKPRAARLLDRAAAEQRSLRISAAAHTPRWCRVPDARAPEK